MSPQSVRCDPMTSQSLHISWDSVPPSQARGHLLGYRVVHSPLGKCKK